ncbi:MAG: enoyl-CoA hydratase/isomerase family protein [Candidatus Aeolococcus gillhamiae]|uniref:Enoyl-CoA hydratase/isomerase family protein n=1 Tax=Candidatus Aeolococcus gillhamiae TaxID=3127015 RepID=A0A2W5Z3V0_9BACT|nr:MAG: enoyl-CoA hydratase/isomerase family protein [Candidatus Dormibacter sp. RRmetagenome_bin12]
MSRVMAPQVTRSSGGRVARIVIGPGVRRNALTSAGWAGIERAVGRLATDDSLRVVVIEGASGWFCAGSDIREWDAASMDDVELSFQRMEAACRAVEELPVPVIGKVRGAAAGAGCQLALACDLRVMSDNASIGMPIAVLGILVSVSFANRLTAVAGAAAARELLYTGRMVGAEEAVRLGLANACVRGEDLDRRVDQVIDSILGASGAAVRAAKSAVSAIQAPARVAAGAVAGGSPVAYDDFSKGVDAFLHRRRARAHRVAR